MRLIGARVTEVDEGVVEMKLTSPELSQQHGYFHAGIIATLVDTAGGRRCDHDAARQRCADGGIQAQHDGARGRRKLRARAEVIKSGRTLTITQGKVWVMKDGKETLCAMMQQTLIALPQK